MDVTTILLYILAWAVAAIVCYLILEEFAGKPETLTRALVRMLGCIAFNSGWFLTMWFILPISIISILAHDIKENE